MCHPLGRSTGSGSRVILLANASDHGEKREVNPAFDAALQWMTSRLSFLQTQGQSPLRPRPQDRISSVYLLRSAQNTLPLALSSPHNTTIPTMSAPRIALRSSRLAARSFRPFTTSSSRFNDTNHRANDTAEQYRKAQTEKPLNPHLTNTNSTIANDMPSLGKDNPPPEMLTSVDPSFTPKDSVPENTERMTGGTQKPAPDSGANAELDVGEIEGGTFKVEPIRRSGEDAATTRARLLCTSRSRCSRTPER